MVARSDCGNFAWNLSSSENPKYCFAPLRSFDRYREMNGQSMWSDGCGVKASLQICNIRFKRIVDKAHLLRAVRLEPNFAPTRLSLAKLLLRANRLNEARTELEIVIALDANLAEAHYQLGLGYSRLRRMDDVVVPALAGRFRLLSLSA